MRFVLAMLCVIIPSTLFASDTEQFIYNEKGKRDPFWPMVSPSGTLITYDEDITSSDMMLEGVVVDATGNNIAIINGKIVKVGDQVGGYTIETIVADHVSVAKGEEHLIVNLKKGGK